MPPKVLAVNLVGEEAGGGEKAAHYAFFFFFSFSAFNLDVFSRL